MLRIDDELARDLWAARGDILLEYEQSTEEDDVPQARSPRSWRVRGLLAEKSGYYDVACAYFMRAIDSAAGNSGDLLTLGRVFRRLGHTHKALAAFLADLRLNRNHVDVYLALADTLIQGARLREAVALYRAAVLTAPLDARVHVGLARALRLRGRLTEALEAVERARLLGDISPDTCRESGAIYMAFDQWEVAEEVLRGAIARASTRRDGCLAELQADLGRLLAHLHRYDEAIAAFRDSLNCVPDDTRTCQDYVAALESKGLLLETVGPLIALGTTQQNRHTLDEAVQCFTLAVERNPHTLQGRLRLGRALMSLGRAHQAVACLRDAVLVAPDHAGTHTTLGCALHLAGRSREGWEEFAWFEPPDGASARYLEVPLWDGSPLKGKSIHLWSRPDWPLGDVILLLQYAQDLEAAGARVILEMPEVLLPMAANVPGVSMVVGPGAVVSDCDYHAPLFAIPRHVTTDAGTRRKHPYLTISHQARSVWAERLHRMTGMVVGVCWGEHLWRHRTRGRLPSLSEFGVVTRNRDIRFVSLEPSIAADELVAPPYGVHIERVDPDLLSGLVEIGAAAMSVDLLICPDGDMAHLAGALGIRVWTLLPYGPDWCWGMDGERSRWYPSVTLFRQDAPNEWSGPLKRIVARLNDCSTRSPRGSEHLSS